MILRLKTIREKYLAADGTIIELDVYEDHATVKATDADGNYIFGREYKTRKGARIAATKLFGDVKYIGMTHIMGRENDDSATGT